MYIYLANDLKSYFPAEPEKNFAALMSMRGQIYRKMNDRCTQKIKIGEKYYFIKQHFGVGWNEILKNLCQGKKPVISAENEYHALMKLEKLGVRVPRVVGYGTDEKNPARQKSFILTESLPDTISLEDFFKDWNKAPYKSSKSDRFNQKKILLQEVARITRTLHKNGINHRDLYICHFLLPVTLGNKFIAKSTKLYLIDLHRAQNHKKIPSRWIIKDLAGLYFSSKDIGLTRQDLLRFVKYYRNVKNGLSATLAQEKNFWKKVLRRGNKLYKQHT